VDTATAEIHRPLSRRHISADVAWARPLVEEALGVPRTAHHPLVLWSDTRFEHSHRLYDGWASRTRERTVPGDINASREYRFERDV